MQRAVKYLTNSLPFTTWDVYFSMFSGTILWINIFLLLEQSNVLSSWINFKRRLSSHWTSKFKKEGIKVSVLWYILGYSPVLTGNIRSPDVFKPIGHKQKYLMDYKLRIDYVFLERLFFLTILCLLLQDIFEFYFQSKYNISNKTLHKLSHKQIVQFQFSQNYVAISTA